MAEEKKTARPVWFFTGLVLMIIGGIIFLIGMYYFLFPSHTSSVLQVIHPNLWWGGILLILGGVFLFLNRGFTVE